MIKNSVLVSDMQHFKLNKNYLDYTIYVWSGFEKVYVTNPDQSPAENVDVLVKPGDVKGLTSSNGMAKVTVNIPGGGNTLQITVSHVKEGFRTYLVLTNENFMTAYQLVFML